MSYGLFGHNSFTDCPISGKFCTMNWQEAERHANKGHMTKTAHFQNLRWRTAAILKIVKSKYLTENIVGIFTKFGVLQQILNLMRF